MNRIILSVIAAGLFLVATSPAFAAPFLDAEWAPDNAGDSLTQVVLFVDGDDGAELSFFVSLTFTGPFNEIAAFGGGADAIDDSPTYEFDPVYTAAKGQDSFFYTNANFVQVTTLDHGTDSYVIEAGTGGGSQHLRISLGQLVVPTGEAINYHGVISRQGANHEVAGVIMTPEPGTFLMMSLGLAGLVAFDRRNRASC
jgi:hypothetical protein